ncbi:DUF6207 family protein [Streptomyces sp. NPDC126497]|uniref:DUF6207 family protein n=1 Tax=Streptomyces sp. NPDC126497 TaxID=3155313 RepID=UPI00332ED146
MRPLNDAHVAEPGLAVVEVAAADDETAFAFQELLPTHARRSAGKPQPSVRPNCSPPHVSDHVLQ